MSIMNPQSVNFTPLKVRCIIYFERLISSQVYCLLNPYVSDWKDYYAGKRNGQRLE